jgi:hypothetical protein
MIDCILMFPDKSTAGVELAHVPRVGERLVWLEWASPRTTEEELVVSEVTTRVIHSQFTNALDSTVHITLVSTSRTRSEAPQSVPRGTEML